MMVSKVRTPKTFCSKPYVVEFTVKNHQIFYSVLVWNESGTNQSLIKSGKYNGEKPKSLITNLIKCRVNNFLTTELIKCRVNNFLTTELIKCRVNNFLTTELINGDARMEAQK